MAHPLTAAPYVGTQLESRQKSSNLIVLDIALAAAGGSALKQQYAYTPH
jgi:hypothetical protein